MSESTPTEPSPVLPYAATTPSDSTVQIGYVGLKLLGIYFIVQMVELSGLISLIGRRYMGDWNYITLIFSYAVPRVTQGIIGIVLYRYSERLAVRIFGTQGMQYGAVSRSGVMTLIISGIGLFLVVMFIPTLFQQIIDVNKYQSRNSSISTGLIDTILHILFGAGMFFLAPRFAGSWSRHLDRRSHRSDPPLVAGL